MLHIFAYLKFKSLKRAKIYCYKMGVKLFLFNFILFKSIIYYFFLSYTGILAGKQLKELGVILTFKIEILNLHDLQKHPDIMVKNKSHFRIKHYKIHNNQLPKTKEHDRRDILKT